MKKVYSLMTLLILLVFVAGAAGSTAPPASQKTTAPAAKKEGKGEAPKEMKDAATGMEFIFVKGGCYQMGDTSGDGYFSEKPVHEVCLDDFYMGKYDVTVGQFRKFVDETGYRTEAEKSDGCLGRAGNKWEQSSSFNWKNVGFEQDENHPVVCVTWDDAKAYTEWLGRKSGKKYRLPTEAEWEYAARAGTKGRNYWGDKPADACKYANVGDLSLKRQFSNAMVHECDDGYVFTSPVGKFQPNGYGLYDMMGNVWQWVADWYGPRYYSQSPRNNPAGPSNGQYRVLRGGSWNYGSQSVRASYRGRNERKIRNSDIGFRVAVSSR